MAVVFDIAAMPKNIILCSDGTGNRDVKGRGTNVFKLFEAIDLSEHRTNPSLDTQLAFYDDGVGTRGNVALRALGGAMGYGLKSNVKKLYRELSRVYDPGDRIFLFGFSRGAFTVRTLAGLISTCGVLRGETLGSASHLRDGVEHAYNTYRARYSATLTRAWAHIRNHPGATDAREAFVKAYDPHANVPIEFIGVWDTVDAVGLPYAIADYVNQHLYQFKFSNRTLGSLVRSACHALSIDESRRAFQPVLWDVDDARIRQIWFAGVHSNVGGGYPKQGMSLVALDWMLAHAQDHGLRVQPLDRALLRGHASVDDLMYNPRAGIGALYRWGIRDVEGLCASHGVTPTIHLTVAERIAHGTDDYAPGYLPPRVKVEYTPTAVDDPHKAVRDALLGQRTEAVLQVLSQTAFAPAMRSELDASMAHRTRAWWWLVSAAIGVLGASAALLVTRRTGRASEVPIALLLVSFAGSALAWQSERHWQRRIEDISSELWRPVQRQLREVLKRAKVRGAQYVAAGATPVIEPGGSCSREG